MSKFILTIFLSFLFVSSYSQINVPNSDTLRFLVKKTFKTVKQNSVFRQKVDWTALEPEVLGGLDTMNCFEDFVSRVKLIFSAVGDIHGFLSVNGLRIRTEQKPLNSFRKSLTDAYKKEPFPVPYKTRIFEDKYGYIFVPGNSLNENPQVLAQTLQDSLCKLNPDNLKGIIIDLRLNEGGSNIPVFTGLHQLLGDRNVGAFTDYQGKNTGIWNFKNGKYLKGGRIYVKAKCSCSKNIKVAILLSQITASAGEMLAIAFKGRKNTIFIGEKTYGLTTGVVDFRIDGYMLAISASLSKDRTGKIYNGPVSPDIEIIEGDNFQNLSIDTKVKKAIEWFNGN